MLTFDTSASTCKYSDIPVNTGWPLKLVLKQVGVVTRRDEVVSEGLAHVLANVLLGIVKDITFVTEQIFGKPCPKKKGSLYLNNVHFNVNLNVLTGNNCLTRFNKKSFLIFFSFLFILASCSKTRFILSLIFN